jgi:hypothetical protein
MTLRLRELSDHEQAEVQRIARSHTLGAGLAGCRIHVRI